MEDPHPLDVLGVTTTVGSLAQAQALARDLLAQRLAACVQIDAGVQSVYRWDGRLCEDAEVRLTIKTLPQALPALQAFLDERHPYEVPQVLAVAMRASPGYASWVRGEVTLPGEPAAAPRATR